MTHQRRSDLLRGEVWHTAGISPSLKLASVASPDVAKLESLSAAVSFPGTDLCR